MNHLKHSVKVDIVDGRLVLGVTDALTSVLIGCLNPYAAAMITKQYNLNAEQVEQYFDQVAAELDRRFPVPETLS